MSRLEDSGTNFHGDYGNHGNHGNCGGTVPCLEQSGAHFSHHFIVWLVADFHASVYSKLPDPGLATQKRHINSAQHATVNTAAEIGVASCLLAHMLMRLVVAMGASGIGKLQLPFCDGCWSNQCQCRASFFGGRVRVYLPPACLQIQRSTKSPIQKQRDNFGSKTRWPFVFYRHRRARQSEIQNHDRDRDYGDYGRGCVCLGLHRHPTHETHARTQT